MRRAFGAALIAWVSGCATDHYDRIALNDVAATKLARVHTYYVRTGDREAMACLTDAAYAKAHAKECAGTAMRHHPAARDVVQSVLLGKGCDILFVWDE